MGDRNWRQDNGTMLVLEANPPQETDTEVKIGEAIPMFDLLTISEAPVVPIAAAKVNVETRPEPGGS